MTYTPLAAGLIAAAVLLAVGYAARSAIARHWRAVLPRLPLPTLALAASYGVYSFSALFVPQWVAIVQAAAFELTYIGLAAATDLSPGSRRRAALVSVAAVVVSVVYNTLAGLFHRNPDWLGNLEPWHEWGLAILHGAPLAWVAYVVAQLLLHAEPRTTRAGTRGRARTVRGLVAALRESRASGAALTAAAAQSAADLAHTRAELARVRDELTGYAAHDAQIEREAERKARDLDAQLRDARAETERARAAQILAEAEAARLSAEAAQAGELDARALAQWAAGLGAEGRDIARQLKRSESTVRGWLKTRAVSAAD